MHCPTCSCLLQLLFYFLVMRYIFASISFKLRLLAVFRAYSRLWFSSATGNRIDVANDREARHNSLLAVEEDAAYLNALTGRGDRRRDRDDGAASLLTAGPTTVFVADGRASPSAPDSSGNAFSASGGGGAAELRNPAYTYAVMPPRDGGAAASTAAGRSGAVGSSSSSSSAERPAAPTAPESVGSASSTAAPSDSSSAWLGTSLHAAGDPEAGAAAESDSVPLVRASTSAYSSSSVPVRPAAAATAAAAGQVAVVPGAGAAGAVAGAAAGVEGAGSAAAAPAEGGRIANAWSWWQRTQLRVLGNPYEVREGTLTTRQMRALRHFRLAIVLYIGATAAVSCLSAL